MKKKKKKAPMERGKKRASNKVLLICDSLAYTKSNKVIQCKW